MAPKERIKNSDALHLNEDFDASALTFFREACGYYDGLIYDCIIAGQKFISDTYGRKALNVIDIGCGDGANQQHLRRLWPDAEITLLDNDAALLNKARDTVIDDRTTFVHADAIDFMNEIEPHRYEVVFSSYVLHNIPAKQKAKFIRGVARLLKSKGVFLLVDKITKNESLNFKEFLNQLQGFTDLAARTGQLDEALFWVSHYIRDQDENFRYSVQGLKHLLAKNRLKVVAEGSRHDMDSYILISPDET